MKVFIWSLLVLAVVAVGNGELKLKATQNFRSTQFLVPSAQRRIADDGSVASKGESKKIEKLKLNILLILLSSTSSTADRRR
jgi:hypothetical protein